MSQHYSDPRREADPHALPDVETFQATYAHCPECDRLLISDTSCVRLACPDCPRNPIARKEGDGWFWWPCFPGCLPDGDASGPFETEDEALADARSDVDAEEDEPTEEDEPDEDAITTEDHGQFYQYGKLAFKVHETATGRYRLSIPNRHMGSHGFATLEGAIRRYMEIVQFWPEVWFISDHGNAHRITIAEGKD